MVRNHWNRPQYRSAWRLFYSVSSCTSIPLLLLTTQSWCLYDFFESHVKVKGELTQCDIMAHNVGFGWPLKKCFFPKYPDFTTSKITDEINLIWVQSLLKLVGMKPQVWIRAQHTYLHCYWATGSGCLVPAELESRIGCGSICDGTMARTGEAEKKKKWKE